ncbi:hypothetical protein Pint_03714 [Pistacia integerrima]|uniref:Uncharacterized protein n=1 Tax=Pistacia integerrima TaxID=434235 RepID=A0ACC0Z2U8_9ROSI|nr:hypothetical protein Pint_03714 [Pistacia integerrima]
MLLAMVYFFGGGGGLSDGPAGSSGLSDGPAGGGLGAGVLGCGRGRALALAVGSHVLEGVSFPPVLPDYVEPGKVKVTTLNNGIRIASATSAVCLPLAGEDAFKGTKNRSHLHIVRKVEATGGNISASASREPVEYTFDALKTYVPEMVELLVGVTEVMEEDGIVASGRNDVFRRVKKEEQLPQRERLDKVQGCFRRVEKTESDVDKLITDSSDEV